MMTKNVFTVDHLVMVVAPRAHMENISMAQEITSVFIAAPLPQAVVQKVRTENTKSDVL